MGFTFDIVYRSGSTNVVADALSRQDHSAAGLGALLTTSHVPWEQLLSQIQQDPFISQLTQDIQGGKQVPKGYTLLHGTLFYKGRLVLPKRSSLVNSLLKEYHDSLVGGHPGDIKTYKRLASE